MSAPDEYAFPSDHSGLGMTLRDYFAAKAMQAGIGRWGGAGDMFDEAGCTHSRLAEHSYQIADAMIAERDKVKT